LIKLAESRGAPISASHASLRQMISDMERGRRKPGHYKPLLCDLFGRTPDELGFADEEPATTPLSVADLGEMLTRASAVTPSAVADLQRQVDGLRTLDRQLGSPAVVEPTRQLVQTMQELMAHVLAGGAREALAVVLSDAAALNAWQVLNTGDVRRAWELHNIARTAGLESGRPDLLAHAMGEQTYGLLDIDRPHDAVHLVEAAQEVASNRVSPLLVAWLQAAAAEAYAAAGDALSCRSALDAASRALPRDTDNSETPYLPSTSGISSGGAATSSPSWVSRQRWTRSWSLWSAPRAPMYGRLPPCIATSRSPSELVAIVRVRYGMRSRRERSPGRPGLYGS
jgi:hypothetical protein